MKTREELKTIKKMDSNMLVKELSASREKLFELQKKHSLDKLKNTSELSKMKKNIARISTTLREKIVAELVDQEAKKIINEKEVKNNKKGNKNE